MILDYVTGRLPQLLADVEHNDSWFTGLIRIAEVVHNTDEFAADSLIQRKIKVKKLIESLWYADRNKHSQGKLKRYTA